MRKRNRKTLCRKIVLRLPDLDHAKADVLTASVLLILGETISSLWSSSSPGIALNRALL